MPPQCAIIDLELQMRTAPVATAKANKAESEEYLRRRDEEAAVRATTAAEAISHMKRDTFPPELVVEVLQQVVSGLRTRVHIADSTDIEELAKDSLLAISEDCFTKAAKKCILENATIEISPAFTKTSGNTIFAMPESLNEFAESVHHIVLRIKQQIAMSETYPRQIYQAVDGITSLAGRFPNLKTCLLQVDYDVAFQQKHSDYSLPEIASRLRFSKQRCRKGFGGASDLDTELAILLDIKTFTESSILSCEIEELVGKFVGHGPGRKKTFRIELAKNSLQRIFGSVIALQDLKAVDPAQALGKTAEQAKSQDGSVVTAEQVLEAAWKMARRSG